MKQCKQTIMDGFAEKRKGQNWFVRQFSREMSQDYGYADDAEYSTAVAAAAFAINNFEESKTQAQRGTNESPGTTWTKIMSKAEDRTSTESKKISDQVSDKRPKESVGPSQSSIKRTPTTKEEGLNSTASALPEKTSASAPSIKKTPTFADTNLSSTATTKPENAVPKPNIPSTKQSTVAPTEIRRQPSIKSGTGNTKADDWEKAEMMKIKERYEKLSAKILDWENKKKTKAKRQIERQEAELDRRRAKALQHYRSKIGNIDQIAEGARAQAEENRRNEEFKVKEKANKIRATGEVPVTCFCC
ncbi:hypothetical protein LguiA_000418 [Lonicera macranthoides]